MSSITGNRMKERRKQLGMSAESIASFLGVSPATVYRYERGDIEKLPGTILGPLSEILRTTPDYLMGWTDDCAKKTDPPNLMPIEPMERIPLLGAIACGDPILAQENIEDYVDLPRTIKADFALICEGDSMIDAGIHDGDVVYIRSQPEVQNGQIAAVLVDGENATLKRFYFSDGVVTLMAANQAYPPIVKAGSDVEQVRVLGLAVGLSRSFLSK